MKYSLPQLCEVGCMFRSLGVPLVNSHLVTAPGPQSQALQPPPSPKPLTGPRDESTLRSAAEMANGGSRTANETPFRSAFPRFPEQEEFRMKHG